MVIEDTTNKVIEYLKKESQANTFRLARELGIDRHKILRIIKGLEEKQAVQVKSGKVIFLKFPAKEKAAEKPIKVKKALLKPRKKIKHKAKKAILENIQAENKKLKETIKELEQKASAPPKVVRRTIVKKVPVKVKEYVTKIKKIPIKSKKLKEQAECIAELEETIRKLKKKASAPPKIIRKTIIKKVPVKVKEEIKPKKFKLPEFNITWLKNIQELKRPEFIEQKMKIGRPKINFAELNKLNKKIQQLHVPEMLR